MEVIGFLAASTAVTKVTDMIRNLFDKNDTAPSWTWNVVPFAIGIIGALMFNIENAGLPSGLRFGLTGVGAQIFTGLVLGGLSSGWHEVFAMWSNKSHNGDRLAPSTVNVSSNPRG